MSIIQNIPKSNFSKTIFFGMSCILLFLVSCTASQPRLKEISQEIKDEVSSSSELKYIVHKTAKNLISVAASNYSPKYAGKVEELFEIMVDPEPAVDSSNTETRGLISVQAPIFGDSEIDTQKNDLAYQEIFGINKDEKISIDVGLLVQRASENGVSAPVAFDDGERLYSYPDDLMAGDKVKMTFQVNCNCYVYIVGIDGTGFVAPIYPNYRSGQFVTRVVANRQMTIPQDNGWLALDGQEGVETIYVIASLLRRPDLEAKTRNFAKTQRDTSKKYIPVTQAPILSRGIVTVKDGKLVSVDDSLGDSHSFLPTSYLSEEGGDYLAVTRWFFQENIQNNLTRSGL